MNDFGKWLKTVREESGLSLRQVEQRIDKLCTFGYLNQLEKGKKGKKGQVYQPDLEIVDALAKVFHKPINEARRAAGYAPLEKSPEYYNALDALIEKLKERVLTSGAGDIADPQAQVRLFEDIEKVAETMIQQEIRRQQTNIKTKANK